MSRKSVTAATGSIALCVLLAGCGGSSGNETKDALSDLEVERSEVKCGMGNGKPAEGEPIKVRAMTTASGGVDFSSSVKSAQAFFDCANANGGVNGRPIDYAYEDDAFNPQKGAQIAAKFASDESIVALAGDSTFVNCGVANDAYARADLYSITGVGVPRSCFHSSNIAPVNSGPRISAVSTVQYFNGEGKNKIAQVGTKSAGNGDWVQAGVKAYAAENGMDVVKSILHDPGVKDANSIVLDAKSADADFVVLQDPAPDSAASLKAAETQNLKDAFQWSCLASCYDATFPGQIGAYWEGFIANSELTLVDAETPDNLLWRQSLDTYGTKEQPRDTFSQAGWLAAKMLTDALLELDPADITRKTVSEAVVGIKGYESDMLCQPWYYGKADEHNANHATRMVVVKDGRYEELSGCDDARDPDLKTIRAREQSEGLLTAG